MSDCKAELHIGDDYGDNHATMRCQREHGHGGMHREEWRDGKAIVSWQGDDSDE